jgi:hypothetical protein
METNNTRNNFACIYKKIIKYKMPGRHGDSDSQNAAEAGTFDTLRDEGEYFVGGQR